MKRLFTCPTCRGDGQGVNEPCRTCKGTGNVTRSERFRLAQDRILSKHAALFRRLAHYD